MSASEDLDRLPTQELQKRAFDRAKSRLDVGFLWKLVEATPAAEAVAGHLDEAEQDILSFAERVADALRPDSPEEVEAFRPIYLEYLREQEEG